MVFRVLGIDRPHSADSEVFFVIDSTGSRTTQGEVLSMERELVVSTACGTLDLASGPLRFKRDESQ